MKIGITFDFEQCYLPTKRYKNPSKRKMVTCRDIDVHYIEEKDFPVAIRVKDFDVLSHNWEDEKESKYDTLDYRFDGKHLYEEPRLLSGSDKGELVFSSGDAFIEHLRKRGKTLLDYLYYHNDGKEFQEGVSVVVTDDLDNRVKELQSLADEYLICNGKVWKKCGQPYYKVQTFGLGHNHGGTGFFIEWTYDENRKIDKNYFLATQRDLALEDFRRIAEGRGDTDSIKDDDSEKRYIEILIPESYTLKRDIESSEYPGYMWNDDRQVYVKEYVEVCAEKSGVAKVYEIAFRHDWGDKCIARVTSHSKTPNLWAIIGQVLTDVKNVSVSDIGGLRCDGQEIMNCLQ